MTRQEFLDGLRSALGNDLNGPIIQENVDYYNSYINDEMRNGRTEEEVIAELGDPWVIAQTIIASSGVQIGAGYQETYDYGTKGAYDDRGGQAGKSYIRKVSIWWKRLLPILGIVVVFVVILSVVGGIVSLLAPLLVPILFIVIIVRIFNSRR